MKPVINFLTVNDFSKEQLLKMLKLADLVKKSPERYQNALRNKKMALIFQKTSTRTRLSFEVGMLELGGHPIYIDWRTTNFILGALEDEMRCVGRYVDIIMARVYSHKDLIKMISATETPIINGLSDLYHPCQALADFQTMFENLGRRTDFKLTFVGDGNNNVTHSLMLMSAKLGNECWVACPKEYQPAPEVMEIIQNLEFSDKIHVTSDLEAAMKDADVVYADTFVSMGKEEESRKRLEKFKPYQLNADLVSTTGKETLIMHCLPAHRDIEITSEVLDSEQSIVFDQAENRLHSQKALLITLMKENIKDRDIFDY